MSLMCEAGATPPEVMDQVGHKSAKLALEVYARKLNCDRETGKRMDALIDWAQTDTSKDSARASLADERTGSAA